MMVREYQTLGVLPAPRKVGRVALYGEEHLTRWRAIARLQERGYSLAAIADLFDAWETGATLPTVLGVSGGQPLGALDETPVIADVDDLVAELPAVFAAPRMARRAERAGLVHRVEDDRYAVRSPALVHLVADAVGAGVPAGKALGIVEAIDAHTRAISDATVRTLIAHVLDDRSPDSTNVLRRGRPLLAQAVASTLIHHIGLALTEAAADRPDIAGLVDDLRVGAVRDATKPRGTKPRKRST